MPACGEAEGPGNRIFHLDFMEEWPLTFFTRCRRRISAAFFFLKHAILAFRRFDLENLSVLCIMN